MKTVKENLLNRLSIQAQEADFQGLTKVASALTKQVELNSTAVRKDEQMYVYAKDEFKNDMNNILWSAIVRMADFYDVTGFNPERAQNMAERVVTAMVKEFCVENRVDHGVGAHEPALPGEEVVNVILEVE